MFLIGLIVGILITILLYSCIIVSKDMDEKKLENTNYSKDEMIAYILLTIYTLKNSASGNDKFNNITLENIENELEVILNIYDKDLVISTAEKIKNK